jgi:rhodanese-related sulfurtransferase
MKKAMLWASLFGAVLLIVIAGYKAWTSATEEKAHRISAEELKSYLDDGRFIVIDVRSKADWEKSASKIKGAIRERGEDVAVWAPRYSKDKTIVLYCA